MQLYLHVVMKCMTTCLTILISTYPTRSAETRWLIYSSAHILQTSPVHEYNRYWFWYLLQQLKMPNFNLGLHKTTKILKEKNTHLAKNKQANKEYIKSALSGIFITLKLCWMMRIQKWIVASWRHYGRKVKALYQLTSYANKLRSSLL